MQYIYNYTLDNLKVLENQNNKELFKPKLR